MATLALNIAEIVKEEISMGFGSLLRFNLSKLDYFVITGDEESKFDKEKRNYLGLMFFKGDSVGHPINIGQKALFKSRARTSEGSIVKLSEFARKSEKDGMYDIELYEEGKPSFTKFSIVDTVNRTAADGKITYMPQDYVAYEQLIQTHELGKGFPWDKLKASGSVPDAVPVQDAVLEISLAS
jgi:hypothetical protein